MILHVHQYGGEWWLQLLLYTVGAGTKMGTGKERKFTASEKEDKEGTTSAHLVLTGWNV